MIPSLGNHLWQTTVCVLAAAVLARFVGAQHPNVRHGIWLAASVKFLIPFSLIVAAGQQLAGWTLPALDVPTVPAGLQAIGQPFSGWAIEASAAPAAGAPLRLATLLSLGLAALWLAGAAATLGLRLTQRLRVTAIVARSPVLSSGREVDALGRVLARSGLRRRVTIRDAAETIGPGIVGFLRPVLLWPRGLSSRLTDAGIDAIISHEIGHVRRGDTLTAVVHVLVETLFWFHPLVWWLGARLVDDRERACDQGALALGAHPHTYAQSLLTVCRFSLRSPLPALTGITSSNLSQRVEAIMTYRSEGALDTRRRLLIAATAALILAGPLAAGVITAPSLQRPQATPAIELPVPVEVEAPVVVPLAAQVPPRDPAPPSQAERDEEFRRGALPAVGTPGLTPPAVLNDAHPAYTSEAMRQKIQGTVELEVVIAADGTVDHARVTKSLDAVHGLDESALSAIRQWRFEPAVLNGQPIAVWSPIVMTFRLH
jgi:TonB family protein